MQTWIIRCPSVTYAQKGQRVLQNAGIRSHLTREGVRGCAYGLEFSADNLQKTLALLESHGVIFSA